MLVQETVLFKQINIVTVVASVFCMSLLAGASFGQEPQDETPATPEQPAPVDPSKKANEELCIADDECQSGACIRSDDKINKIFYIGGVFCGVYPDLQATLASTECEKALAPQGCKRISFELRNPDPVKKEYVACPQDMEVKECAKGTCQAQDFYVGDRDDRCTTRRLDSDGRLRK